jgi:mono/diheme cytochrome c family protein
MLAKHLTFAVSIVLVGLAPEVGADQAKAKQNYERYCAACHGFNGMSVAPDTPNLRMNQGLLQPDMQIVQKLKMGSPKKPPMLGILNDQDLLQVIVYTRTLR